MSKAFTVNELFEGIKAGNRTLLGKACTLIESSLPEDEAKASKLLEKVWPLSGNARRMAITGMPGAGKSTFIERFGLSLIDKGNKVGVLTIDPSSTRSGGSILGDKTRMLLLGTHTAAFIRSSPSKNVLGGVGIKTGELILLLEAAGFNQIIIETVGVGQSETEARHLCDMMILLMIAGSGDELQGIKRGIMEMVDLVIVNKADGENLQAAKLARADFEMALHHFAPEAWGWHVKVLTCSALTGAGMDDLHQVMNEYFEKSFATGHFIENRSEQSRYWFKKMLHDFLEKRLTERLNNSAKLQETMKLLKSEKISPIAAFNILKQDFEV